MFIRNLLMTIVIGLSTNVYASSDDEHELILFGYNKLSVQLVEFNRKFIECNNKSVNTSLPDFVIKELKVLEKTFGAADTFDTLSYMYSKAVKTFAQQEYVRLMEFLILTDFINENENENENINYIDELIVDIKIVFFGGITLEKEQYFETLPRAIRDEFNSIEELQTPFDISSIYLALWPNNKSLLFER